MHLINEFEDKFKEHTGSKRALAVTSGTAALHTALVGIGMNEINIVAAPGYTTRSCINPILQVGATPMLIDVELDTLAIDHDELKDAIENYYVDAVILVAMYGMVPRDLDKIVKLCKKHRIHLIIDACQAAKTFHKGKHIAKYGDVGVFSFNRKKHISTGEGGMVVTDSKKIYTISEKFAMRGRGKSKKWREWFKYDTFGLNYRIDEYRAILGMNDLDRLKDKPVMWMSCFVPFRNNIPDDARPPFYPLCWIDDLKEYVYGEHKNTIETYNKIVCIPTW